MELLHPHFAGLDIHKETVVVCVRHLRSGKVTTGIKTFKTTTEELIALSDWHATEGCTHIFPASLKCDAEAERNTQGFLLGFLPQWSPELAHL